MGMGARNYLYVFDGGHTCTCRAVATQRLHVSALQVPPEIAVLLLGRLCLQPLNRLGVQLANNCYIKYTASHAWLLLAIAHTYSNDNRISTICARCNYCELGAVKRNGAQPGVLCAPPITAGVQVCSNEQQPPCLLMLQPPASSANCSACMLAINRQRVDIGMECWHLRPATHNTALVRGHQN
jgi:hypothetical protein